MQAQHVKPKKRVKKRRPKYGRIIFSLLFMVMIIYFMVRLGIDLFVKQHDTVIVDYGALDIKDDYHALILRNEIVIKTQLKGSVTYFASEGDLVMKGEPLAEIFNNGHLEVAESETEDTSQIDAIEYDYTVIEYDIMTLKDKILFALQQNDYLTLPELKRDSILKLEMREKLEGENKFLANRMSSYSEQTIGEGHLSLGEKRTLFSPADGILTYQLDGYEDYLTIDNIYNLNYDEIDEIVPNKATVQQNNIQTDSPMFKLVDQSTYYLLLRIDMKDVETYKQIQTVNISTADMQMDGEVYDVFSNDEGAMVVIRLNENGNKVYDKRWLDCTVVNKNFKGLKIPVDAIVTRDEIVGVYRVLEDRRLKFIPIKVLGYDDVHAIVQAEQFYDEEKGVLRTLSVSQEVVRDALQYKEGDLVE